MCEKEITKEQRIEAIEKSIKHWENDILKPMKEGRKVSGLHWADKGDFIPIFGDDCPLCTLYTESAMIGPLCKKCPLQNCDQKGSTWNTFMRDPNIKNAESMIYELKAILILEDRKAN